MGNKTLSNRWAEMDVEALVEAAVDGNGDPEMIQEAKELMETTIASRDEE
jgi:hypothetical protein